MTAPLNIEVGELILPGMAKADGAIVAETMRDEIGRLYRLDLEDGVSWRTAMGPVTLELDGALPPERVGKAVARRIRALALQPEQAQ